MLSFRFSIDFYTLGQVVICENQCWLVHNADGILTDSFFDWLGAKKFHREGSIEYADSQVSTSDIYVAGRYYKTLRFGFSEDESTRFYYQQRYHATENESVETLRDFMGNFNDPYLQHLAGKLGIDKLYEEKINMLSTGEYRKAVTLKASMTKPKVLFIDEPYSGLDTPGCRLLNELFHHLVHGGTTVVLFTSSGCRPDFVTHELDAGNILVESSHDEAAHVEIPGPFSDTGSPQAFRLEDVTAIYNGRDVLHNVNWQAGRGEKWSLTGMNGAGKSTLLSFIYADNPQVYRNKVWLFGRKRGSGESIWEVKDRIGFYSSELHRYFNKMQPVRTAIDSIIYQNPYEKRILTDEEENFRLQLTGYFGLSLYDHNLMCELPATIQKLVLLAAVLAKNAPLLILDEPFQGLSGQLVRKIVALLERYVSDRSFIMVSHNHSDFPSCVNRHFHMENGTGKEITSLFHDLGQEK